MTKWDKICRACLAKKESFFYYFYDNVEPEVYWFCTSIEVKKDEQLPKALCGGCYELLVKLSEFKRICLQSQTALLECSTLKTELKDLVSQDSSKNYSDEDKMGCNVAIKVEEASDHFDNDISGAEELSIETVNKKSRKSSVNRVKKVQCGDKLQSKSKRKDRHFIFKCQLCNKRFNYQKRFEAHRFEHEGKTVSISCGICEKTFMTWSGLKRHNDNEHTLISLGSLKCNTCGKIFKSRQTLSIHQKMHGDRRLCICNVCGKSYTTPLILKTHLETHSEKRERQYTCKHCGKQFYTGSTLRSHVSKRHSGRRYICQVCSYPFTNKYNLSKHLLIHDGKKPYKCDICQKCYATQASLVEHKRTHSGERPFLCIECPKSFLSKRRLVDHFRTHSGERPYKCALCEQKFTQRGTLNRHMKVHEKATALSCVAVTTVLH